MDYKERLIRDCETGLLPYFSTEDIGKISSVITMVLSDYRVTDEPRELSVLDDYNDRCLNRYLNCIAIEGKSAKTVEAYRRELQKVANVIRKNYKDMTAYDLRYYLATMKARGLSNTTMENSRAYMSSFFQWMTAEEFVVKNPMLTIKPIKTNPKKEEPFRESEIDAIRRACKNVKERVIIEVALSSGLRCEELSNLKISDVDLKTQTVHVRHGKGDKDRVTYIDELTATWIEKYLLSRKDNVDIMFLSQIGGGSKYTKSGIYRTITQIGNRAGVKSVHPHRFRHTMASKLVRKGMPLNEIQSLLGHSDINTTMRYVHIGKETIESSYRRLSE